MDGSSTNGRKWSIEDVTAYTLRLGQHTHLRIRGIMSTSDSHTIARRNDHRTEIGQHQPDSGEFDECSNHLCRVLWHEKGVVIVFKAGMR